MSMNPPDSYSPVNISLQFLFSPLPSAVFSAQTFTAGLSAWLLHIYRANPITAGDGHQPIDITLFSIFTQ